MKIGLKSILHKVDSRSWIGQIIDDALSKEISEVRSGSEFHASWAGLCPRLIQYIMNGLISEKVEPRIQRVFDVGKDMHLRYARYFKIANKLIGVEVPIDIHVRDIHIVGKADMIVTDFENNKHILELKTINDKGFKALKSPKKEHFLQWNIYSKGLNIPTGVILYENKDTQEFLPYSVEDKSFFVSFSQEDFDTVVDMFSMIDDCNKKSKLVPKPECPDKYCPALKICKNGK